MSELGIFYPTIPEGGGGDFSTAIVTVIIDSDTIHTIVGNGAFYGNVEGSVEASYFVFGFNSNNTSTPIILYKGNAIMLLSNDEGFTGEVIEGNATYNNETRVAKISGNCTIKISSSSEE